MIGQKLGSFLIEAELGSGAMGVVYRGVRDSGKTRVAAVKVINLEMQVKGNAYERFVREAEILEQFRHPNIVRYLARGKSGKIFYYAMEFIPGATLDKVIERRGPLPWADVVRYAIQICDALHYAHEHSVVHRDLKPSNLMLSQDDQIKLTDFGIAKDLDATALTATGRTLGTAAYMAPEQIRGTPEVSHKTDLYALGIVLYQMLTGDLPFRGRSAMVLMHCHMNEPAPRPSAKATENLPVALDDLVLALMAKERNDRPWDAAAVAQSLRELQEQAESGRPVAMVWPEEGTSAHNPTRTMDVATPKAKSGRKRKKKRPSARLREAVPTIGMVAALIVVGGAIGYLVWPPSAKYLHAQAGALMASKERTDWMAAQERYLDELDRRFPDHAYKEETEGWRDRIALTSAERRAEVLEKSAVPGYKKAETQGESLYAAVFPEADAAARRYDERDAARRWREMAASLKDQGGGEERGWRLLAARRAAAIEAAIAARGRLVAEGIASAEAAEARGQADQALLIRRDLLDRFGKYTDTADALAPVRSQVLPSEHEGTSTPATGRSRP